MSNLRRYVVYFLRNVYDLDWQDAQYRQHGRRWFFTVSVPLFMLHALLVFLVLSLALGDQVELFGDQVELWVFHAAIWAPHLVPYVARYYRRGKYGN